MMKIKELNQEEIIKVYNEHMILDFPSEELKPVEVMLNLLKKKIYICYGLYDNEDLLAYAFIVTLKEYMLIDYYAVCEKHRNKGIGSKLLAILKEQCKDYNGIFVEVEKVEEAFEDAEKLTRKRRIEFYKRNGFKMTKISIELFKVNFSVMCLYNKKTEESVIYKGLEGIYKEIVKGKLYLDNVKLSLLN